MGNYCSINLALKGEAAANFRKDFLSADTDDSFFEGASITEGDGGQLYISWNYDKRDTTELSNFLCGQNPKDFLYSERDEDRMDPEFGTWFANPFFKASKKTEFSTPKEAFEKLALRLSQDIPKEDVLAAMKDAMSSFGKRAAPKP